MASNMSMHSMRLVQMVKRSTLIADQWKHTPAAVGLLHGYSDPTINFHTFSIRICSDQLMYRATKFVMQFFYKKNITTDWKHENNHPLIFLWIVIKSKVKVVKKCSTRFSLKRTVYGACNHISVIYDIWKTHI